MLARLLCMLGVRMKKTKASVRNGTVTPQKIRAGIIVGFSNYTALIYLQELKAVSTPNTSEAFVHIHLSQHYCQESKD